MILTVDPSPWDEFLAWTQTNLGAGIVSGLFVAAVLGLVAAVPRLRRPVVGGLKKAGKWMSGLRVTTAAARDKSIADALEARRPKIVRQPRWVVAPHKSERGTWLLGNVSEGARARDVTLEAPVSEFTFMGGADWDEIVGDGVKTFRGYPTEGGAHFGVDFYAEWTDEANERRSASVRWQRPSGYSGLL